MARRSKFGNIQKLSSGNFRARHKHPYKPFTEEGRRNWVNAPETFPKRKQAEVWLARQQALIADGKWKDAETIEAERAEAEAQAKRDACTLQDLATEWLGRYEGNTYKRHESLMRNHILPKWGEDRLIDLNARDVRLWLEDSFTGHKDTRLKVYETMTTCLRYAKKDGLIPAVPMPDKSDIRHGEDSAKHAAPVKAKASLTLAQMEDIALAIHASVMAKDGERKAEEYATAIRLMGHMGMRKEEVRGLKPDMIERRTDGSVWLTVRRVITGHGVHTVIRERPKNEHSARTIPVPEHFAADLWGLAQATPRGGWIFTAKDGKAPMSEAGIRSRLDAAARRLDLGHVTAHDFRHSFITEAMYFAPKPALDAYDGHAAQDMQGYYARVRADQLEALADSVTRALGDSMAGVASLDERRAQA